MNGRLPSLISGVDEAGRGCVIGPLVVAGITVSRNQLRILKEIGVKDSKVLSKKVRLALYPELIKLAYAKSVIKITPSEIDEYVLRGVKLRRLNYLEAMKMAKVIESLGANYVYVDAPDVNPARFASDIISHLSRRVKVISSHHADSKYIAVSAASIVAKVERDREIGLIKRKYGDFGSGYPSDPKTVLFLRKWVRETKTAPPFTRISWKTWRDLSKVTLDDF